MGIFRNRRVTLVMSAVGILGAASALAIGASYALFSSTANPQTATISTATVTLNNGAAPASGACTFSDIVPNEMTPTTCTYTVTYTGSANAWIFLNVSTESKAGTIADGLPLINSGSDAAYGLIPTITTSNTYGGKTQVFGWGAASESNCSASQTTAGWTSCSSDTNQMVNACYKGGTVAGSSCPTTFTFTIAGAMNNGTAAQNNPYQGGSAAITVQAWALQSTNNEGNNLPIAPNGPMIQSVTPGPSSDPTSLTVGYNVPVFVASDSGTGAPSPFYTTDVTQSTATTPDVCQYTIASPAASSGSLSSTTVDLALASCTGAHPAAGDVLNLTYDYNNGGYPATRVFGAPGQGRYPQSPQMYWNITVG